MVNSKWIREALVFYDGDNQARWLDAIGNNVVKFELETGTPCDDTTGLPTRFVSTVVNSSTVVNAATAGNKLLITDDAAEYDGACLTLRGEAFALSSGCPAYFGAKLTCSHADSELLLGLTETLTAYHAAAAHTVIAAALDGAFFYSATAAAVYAQVYENNTQSSSATVATGKGTDAHIYEIYWDGTYVNFFYDGTLVTATATTLTTGALTPTLHFRNGTGNARNCIVHWMRAIQVN